METAAPAIDLATPDGLRAKRDQLVAEITQAQQAVQAYTAKARECAERAVFLNGAVAMLNDQLGDTPAPPAAAPANRAARRRARKAR